MRDDEIVKSREENGANNPVIIALDQLCETILGRRKKK
jgi:hypothetical protein